MDDLTIDKEFESLCGTLSQEEITRLTNSIRAMEGCRDPIIVWANHQDTILDGHNRYRICKRYGYKYKIKAIKLDTRDDALNWIVSNQLGRRNLDESQRAMLAAKLASAKRGGDHSANLPNATTQAAAAEKLNVSTRSVTSAAKVIEDGVKPLQRAVEAGEIPVSTAATVAELPPAQQQAAVAKGPEGVKAAAKKAKEKKARKPKAEPVKDWKWLLDAVVECRRRADTMNVQSGKKGQFNSQFQDTCGILDDIVRDWRKVK